MIDFTLAELLTGLDLSDNVGGMNRRPHNPLYGRDLDGERFIGYVAQSLGDTTLTNIPAFQEFCLNKRTEGLISAEVADLWTLVPMGLIDLLTSLPGSVDHEIRDGPPSRRHRQRHGLIRHGYRYEETTSTDKPER